MEIRDKELRHASQNGRKYAVFNVIVYYFVELLKIWRLNARGAAQFSISVSANKKKK